MSDCPHCAAHLADDNGVYSHIKAKHGKAKARAFRQEHMPPREPSIGEELAEALLSARCGDEVPEHIALMFPSEISEARAAGRKDAA
ncbi:hypothetical protein [Aureimonas psammosilenae]|uniref:hypothetical protein n=1 Tax=Aureimonas psammosilenae TaxID=2495496 RepID=UPI001260B8F4|nr:hypothetical protein [Aureimonas psammosilenae]